MSVFVFLGPSLPRDQARAILDATYLPPVAMGDMYALMQRQPRVIAIIDGVFQRVPAVWHKEILWALAQGVQVLGSSSMGALRAAELHPYGMQGAGQIFEAYRDGVLEDDDEVALIHAPAELGYRPLSAPMVNIRAGLQHAEARGLIAAATHQALCRAAKAMFYPERSWPSVLKAGRALNLPADELEALKRFVRDAAPDVKRADAIALLRRIAQARASEATPSQPRLTFEPTYFWLQMAQEIEMRLQAPSETLAGHVLSDSQSDQVAGTMPFTPSRHTITVPVSVPISCWQTC